MHQPMDVEEQSRLSSERIFEIACETRGQTANVKWWEFRRNKLTASLFGRALRAADNPRDSVILSIASDVSTNRNLDYIPAIRWGKEHEADAARAYSRITSTKVISSGIWLFPSGNLGASPDGIVMQQGIARGILEVKCPFSMRDMSHLQMKRQGCLPPYIDYNLKLKRSHDYYHQVQGQLAAVHAPWCDFVMWTTKSVLIDRVLADAHWAQESIPKLDKFYRDKLAPLVSKF